MVDEALVERLLSVAQVQPGRCDHEVWERGEPVLVVAGPRSWMIEAWVLELAARSGARVDWSQYAGRAVVQAVIGDAAEREALGRTVEQLLPSLAAAAERAHKRGSEHGYPLQIVRTFGDPTLIDRTPRSAP
jgi:hypothetical protein